MSIKKTEIKITIEQKQTWRISQGGARFPGSSRVADLALPENREIIPSEITFQTRSLQVPRIFGKQIIRLFQFLKRIKRFVRRN